MKIKVRQRMQKVACESMLAPQSSDSDGRHLRIDWVAKRSVNVLSQLVIASSLIVAICVIPMQSAHAQTCESSITASQPASQYSIANGVVIDLRTSLMWDQCAWGLSGGSCTSGDAASYSWQLALGVPTTANSVQHKGYGDWRLPNIKELHSLVEMCRMNPSINSPVFPNAIGSYYATWLFWSNSPSSISADTAWAVTFYDGLPTNELRSSSFRVRLVRAGR